MAQVGTPGGVGDRAAVAQLAVEAGTVHGPAGERAVDPGECRSHAYRVIEVADHHLGASRGQFPGWGRARVPGQGPNLLAPFQQQGADPPEAARCTRDQDPQWHAADTRTLTLGQGQADDCPMPSSLTVGTAAREARLTPKAVRLYEARGLLPR